MRCRPARIRSVAKNRSATMPTKNGETIAANAVVPYANPICSPEKCRVSASHVPIVTDHAPQTKYWRNIMTESFRRTVLCIGNIIPLPRSRVPRPLCDGGYIAIETRRRKIDRAALFGAQISGHQDSYDLQTIFKSKRRPLILQEGSDEMPVFGFIAV